MSAMHRFQFNEDWDVKNVFAEASTELQCSGRNYFRSKYRATNAVRAADPRVERSRERMRTLMAKSKPAAEEAVAENNIVSLTPARPYDLRVMRARNRVKALMQERPQNSQPAHALFQSPAKRPSMSVASQPATIAQPKISTNAGSPSGTSGNVHAFPAKMPKERQALNQGWAVAALASIYFLGFSTLATGTAF